MLTKIKTGSTYRDGRGKEYIIGGITVVNPEWFWARGGDWFDGTGRRVEFTPERGYFIGKPGIRDLVEEVV